ncbi:PTS sugar transporter subunit IIA [Agrilactobacillus fermenti]|uniref:PTS sugar transporter subunit IIA n=1 Tax=Agrilactobacillus fermenti TaxID=2586909 RepID=UPI003A5BD744
MKTEQFEPRFVQLQRHAEDWQDALRVSAQPLVTYKYITSEYINKMIAGVQELGPYIVIAPGIALGHSRPDSSVLQTGFSITTLAEPVKFGSQTNDPVDIVIILASTSNDAHLALLQKLVQFLGTSENLQILRAAKTDNDIESIVQLINGGAKDEGH